MQSLQALCPGSYVCIMLYRLSSPWAYKTVVIRSLREVACRNSWDLQQWGLGCLCQWHWQSRGTVALSCVLFMRQCRGACASSMWLSLCVHWVPLYVGSMLCMWAQSLLDCHWQRLQHHFYFVFLVFLPVQGCVGDGVCSSDRMVASLWSQSNAKLFHYCRSSQKLRHPILRL